MSWLTFLLLNLLWLVLLVFILYRLLKRSWRIWGRILSVTLVVVIFGLVWWLTLWNSSQIYYYANIFHDPHNPQRPQALAHLQALQAYNLVFRALGDPQLSLQAFSLIKSTPYAYRHLACQGVKHSNYRLRLACLRFLWEQSGALTWLEQALADPTPQIRAWALQCQAGCSTPDYQRLMAQAFRLDLPVTNQLVEVLQSLLKTLPVTSSEYTQLRQVAQDYLKRWVANATDSKIQATRQWRLIKIVEKIPTQRIVWVCATDYGWIREQIEGSFHQALAAAIEYLENYAAIDPHKTLQVQDRLLYYVRLTGQTQWLQQMLAKTLGQPLEHRWHPYQLRTRWLNDPQALKRWWHAHLPPQAGGRLKARIMYDGEGMANVRLLLHRRNVASHGQRYWSIWSPLQPNNHLWDWQAAAFAQDDWGRSNRAGEFELQHISPGHYQVELLLTFDLLKGHWPQRWVHNLPVGKLVEIRAGKCTDLNSWYVVRKIKLERPADQQIFRLEEDPTITIAWKSPNQWVKPRLYVTPYPSALPQDVWHLVKARSTKFYEIKEIKQGIFERDYSELQVKKLPPLRKGAIYRLQVAAVDASEVVWATSDPVYIHVQAADLCPKVQQHNRICRQQLRIIRNYLLQQKYQAALQLLAKLNQQAPAHTYRGLVLLFQGYCFWGLKQISKALSTFEELIQSPLPGAELARKARKAMKMEQKPQMQTLDSLQW